MPQPPAITTSTAESIAVATVPWDRDDNRTKYLGYRASGFTIREALDTIGVHQTALSHWREQPDFKALELRIPDLRHTLSLEYAHIEFLRNFRLCLAKDFEVLGKSTARMTADDREYLLKIRGYYTPQQLQIIDALSKHDGSQNQINFTDIVIGFQKTKETIIMRGTNESSDVSCLPREQSQATIIQDEETDIQMQ